MHATLFFTLSLSVTTDGVCAVLCCFSGEVGLDLFLRKQLPTAEVVERRYGRRVLAELRLLWSQQRKVPTKLIVNLVSARLSIEAKGGSGGERRKSWRRWRRVLSSSTANGGGGGGEGEGGDAPDVYAMLSLRPPPPPAAEGYSERDGEGERRGGRGGG